MGADADAAASTSASSSAQPQTSSASSSSSSLPLAVAPTASTTTSGDDLNTLAVDDFTCQLLDANERPCQLYSPKVEGLQARCYAEAKEDEHFMVAVAHRGRNHNYRVDVYLRSEWMTGNLLREPGWRAVIRSREVGPDQVQLFRFGKPTLTDDAETSVRDPAAVAALGEVTVRVSKVAYIAPIPKFYASAARPAEQAIYERSKKVGAVALGVGETVVQKTSPNSVTATPDPSCPPVNFVFRCTTAMGLELLKQTNSNVRQEQKHGSGGDDGGGGGGVKAEGSSSATGSGTGASHGGGTRSKRVRETIDFIELEMEEARKRAKEASKQPRAASASTSNTNSSSSTTTTAASSSTPSSSSRAAQRSESPIIVVKPERRPFDRAQKGGSLANPIDLDDLSD